MDASANELAVGDKAKTSGPVDIGLSGFTSLNYLSKYQILATRGHHVNRNTELLLRPYVPTDSVFGKIENNKPWWGVNGAFVFGSGQRSIEGPAEESRFLLNPFLLVGLSPWSAEIWDTAKLSEGELKEENFPYCWMPSLLRWYPERRVIQVLYDVSAYNRSLEYWEPKIKDKSPITVFGLVAYNARDFGYSYLSVPLKDCKNIVNHEDPGHAVEIHQFIHCGNSSGYPGGCNNMSPAQKEIDHLEFTALPATLRVDLFKQDPGPNLETPDLSVIIELR
ncbi:MAG: hypothetical protein AB7V06_24765 [Candidatus Obscuribacterales bacterium]